MVDVIFFVFVCVHRIVQQMTVGRMKGEMRRLPSGETDILAQRGEDLRKSPDLQFTPSDYITPIPLC